MAAPHKMKTEENHTFGLHGGSKKERSKYCHGVSVKEMKNPLTLWAFQCIIIYMFAPKVLTVGRHNITPTYTKSGSLVPSPTLNPIVIA